MPSRLIALNKSYGVCPIEIGDTARHIIDKAILNTTRQCVQEAAGSVQLLKDEVLQLRNMLDQCIEGINSARKLESKSACHSAQIVPPTEDRDMDQSKACLASLSCDQVIYY